MKRHIGTALSALGLALARTSAQTAEQVRMETVAVEKIGPRMECVTFHSTVLDREKRVCAVLPKEYRRDRGGWPCLFLLHGRGRHERSLIDHPDTRDALLRARFVVILPDGDDGWYINSPARPRDRYRDYLEEVIRFADRHYALSPEPARRALGGWSMGGYGCTRFATLHADRFGMLTSVVGLLDFPRDDLPETQSYTVPAERFTRDKEVWTRVNPLRSAERLRGMHILIITGTTAFDRTMNENFHAELERLQIPHRFEILPGGHTFATVTQALALVIPQLNTWLSQQTN